MFKSYILMADGRVTPVLAAVLLTCFLSVVARGEEKDADAAASNLAGHYLILSSGGAFAEADDVEGLLYDFGSHLGAKVHGQGKREEGHLAADAKEALGLIKKHKPLWGIVTPAFYVLHKGDVGMKPIFETRFDGAAWTRYSVYSTDPDLTPEGLEGKRIATDVGIDTEYLRLVVLAAKARPLWMPVDDLSDLLFKMTQKPEEGENKGDKEKAPEDSDAPLPDAVLVDNATAKIFAEDEELSKQFSLVCRSEKLPPDLVVLFTDHGTDKDRLNIEVHLDLMQTDEIGKELMKKLGSETWGELNSYRIDAILKLYELGRVEDEEKPPGKDGK